jgi:3-hydroxyacyl-[acyl-carrier-protein] dehydratase
MTDWLGGAIQRVKRHPLVPDGAGTAVAYGRDVLEQLLPHRAPMLLLDGIDAVDVAQSTVRGYRTLRADDLGFAGHFPEGAIYPGVLLIETMGQLGITLLHFARQRTALVGRDVRPPRVRATRIHHAAFTAPTGPGDHLTVHAMVLEDDYTMIAAGQVFNGDTLAAYAVAEVLSDE